MADFAPNVTPRYRLHYNVAGRTHTIMCRGARNITFAAMQTIGQGVFDNLFTNLASILFDDLLFLSAEIAVTDSDLFFPAALPPAVAGGVGIALATKQDSITHLTFTGRGSLGSKASFHVYGGAFNPDILPAQASNDFVLLASESAPVQGAINDLNLAGNGLVTVDNSKPLFPGRATLKVNDFWLRRARQGL